MSIFDEEKNEHTEQQATQTPTPPAAQNNAEPESPNMWVKGGRAGQTTQHGYGQGYNQNPNQGYGQGYQPHGQGYVPPQYNQNFNSYPPQNIYSPPQYQYNANGGWQQQPRQQQPRRPESYQWNFQDYDKAAGNKENKKKSRGLMAFVIATVSVLAVGIVGLSAYGIYHYASTVDAPFKDEIASESNNPLIGGEPLEIAAKPEISESLPVGGKMTIPQIAKTVGPSVVGVIQYQPDVYLEETGEGSGIIMSADGYVITNAHVVKGGTAFKVVLADGTPKDAELVGADDITDLAVLKVSGVNNLTPAVFGDSNTLEVGEPVVAIGNPGGTTLAGSVTDGIISAVGREIPGLAMIIPLIQTNAAINPGNSGGALVNEYGQVIGINSSKIVAEGYEGICFAIPISEAKPIIDKLVTSGRVTGRVKLGIHAREIDEIDARSTGLKEGIRIEEIDSDSDLVNKNVQRFDIITHIDGERLYTMSDLKKILERHSPGDSVKLTLFRQVGTVHSETFDVTVVLVEDK